MTDVAPLWLGLLGAITGILGLITAIASAWYTRRAAIAAEGPPHPDIEVARHGWSTEGKGWYSFDIIIRNRTGDAWELASAKSRGITSHPIFSTFSRPFTGEQYDPHFTRLDEIPESALVFTAQLGITVGPAGTQHFHGHGGDAFRVSLFIRPSRFSMLTKRLCVSLTLEAKTDKVRHKIIAVKRRLKPTTITPT